DRRSAIFTIRQWLSRGPAQGKLLLDEKKDRPKARDKDKDKDKDKDGEADASAQPTGLLLDKSYKLGEARTLMGLLYDLPYSTWRRPETFDFLARCTRSQRVAIAELGYSHLIQLAGRVKLPAFNASDAVEDRKRFADAILAMVEKKDLPPPLRQDAPA